MAEPSILLHVDRDGIATLTLNRPELHNAFDDAMIAELTRALRKVDDDRKVRVVVLAANGQSFSAGADLNWMKRMAAYSAAENLRDATGLAELMSTLDTLSKPTVARVQGSAYAGGLGLIACCDIAVAARTAQFAVTEVRLGLIPAVIAPYVVRALGARAARRWFLTGERFDAAEAFRLGLIHDLVEESALTETINGIVTHLYMGGPVALGACKEWIARVADRPIDEALAGDSARRIAAIRTTAEAQAGVAAFLAKKDSPWVAAIKAELEERSRPKAKPHKAPAAGLARKRR
jgi:methylglutaconyl-CoA hydratase